MTQPRPFPINHPLPHLAIRAYQLSVSSLMGRHCRHLPSCSSYTDEAIQRHGLWAGGWMGLSRISRCRPGGTAGFDPVCLTLPDNTHWYLPWRYGAWRQIPVCEAVAAAPIAYERAANIKDRDISRQRTGDESPNSADR